MSRTDNDGHAKRRGDGPYEDWLGTIRRQGGQAAWLWQNSCVGLHNLGRTMQQMGDAVLSSKRIRDTIRTMSAQRGVADSVLWSEARQILTTMAFDFRFHSAAQPIGYSLAKVFEHIFSHIWVNSARMCQIREIASDRSVPIVWMPTHRSIATHHFVRLIAFSVSCLNLRYLDFLLLSLLSYHYRIQLPAICAGDDFRASRLLGEALRRCANAFVASLTVPSSHLNDLLYRSIFAEYVQQLLTHGDRPIEFFIEGQRSRTGKSVFPRMGLLQLVVEPFIKAQLYDTVLIPVTIDYDRVLEEQLFAWELVGFSKPRETTMGLLRAHSILREHFGDIRVTIGQPISIRQFFLEKIGRGFDIRLELAGKTPSEMEESIREMVHTLALDVVHSQNANGTLSLWPFVALALLQTLNESAPNSLPISPFAVPLHSLRLKSETFLRLFEKCCANRPIWRRAGGVEDEIRHFVRLHRSHLTFSPSGDSVQLVDLSPPAILPPLLLNSVLLASQANPFVHKMAPFCFGAIVRLCAVGQPNNDNNNGNYHFLQRLFDHEFVPFPDEFASNVDQISDLRDTSDLWSLAQILKPFFIAYHSIFAVLITHCSNELLTSAELTRQILRKFVQIVRQNGNIPMQIASSDIVKNALNSLKAFGLAKMDDQNRLHFDFVELNKLLKQLEHFLASLQWSPLKTENFAAKI